MHDSVPSLFSVLIVEDNPGDRVYLETLLEGLTSLNQCHAASTLAEAETLIRSTQPDVAFVDLGLPDSQGLNTLKRVLAADGETAVIVLTGLNDTATATEAVEIGAQDYLVKGEFSAPLLERTIRYAIARKHADQHVRALQQRLNKLSTSAKDPIFILTDNLQIEWLNQAGADLVGVRPAGAVGCQLSLWLSQRQQAEFIELLTNTASSSRQRMTGIDSATDWEFGARHAQFSFTTWQERDGSLRIGCIGRDVTTARRQQNTLETNLKVQRTVAAIHQLRDGTLSLPEKLRLIRQKIQDLRERCCPEVSRVALLVQLNPQRQILIPDEPDDTDSTWLETDRQWLCANNTQVLRADQPARVSTLLFENTSTHQSALMTFFQDSSSACCGGLDAHLDILANAAGAVIGAHLQRSEINRLYRAVAQSPVGTVITDNKGRIQYANLAMTSISGYAQEELLGKTPRVFKSGLTPARTYQELWQTIQAGHVWRGEIRNRRKSGELCWESMVISPVLGADGLPENFIAVKENIDRRKRDEQQLVELATRDPLTRLPNRSLLRDRLSQAVARARREGSVLAVVLIDLDQFKLINDLQGHPVGDRLLRQVAERLQASVRQDDTLGRLGGDEFVLILHGVGDGGHLRTLLQQYVDQLSEPYQLSEFTAQVSSSLGVALCQAGEPDADELYRRADLAMYQAKQEGGKQFRFYNKELDEKLNHKVWFRQAIKSALTENQLRLYYQPQLNLKSGVLVGLEALIRWQHPDKGLIMPGDFIPLAEETGAVIQIGEWVIEAACRQIRAWINQGFEPPPVAVNLSARQLGDAQLPARIAGYLEKYQLTPEMLELELTESAIMGSPESAIALLQSMRDLGLSISGDDFGTGYSSLSYLKRLPLSKLKIDRSFVIDLTRDNDSRTIAAMIISLAHSLRLKVLAEGIEEEGQWRTLQRMGCDEMQGYLCAKPLPAAECASFCQQPSLISPALISQEEQPGLLLVDDEPAILRALKRALRREGYAIYTAETPADALQILENHEIGVVMSDQRMPAMAGTELLARIRERYPDTVRLVLSGYTDLDTIIESINRGFIYKFLAKPWDDDLLRQQINEAFRFYRMTRRESQFL